MLANFNILYDNQRFIILDIFFLYLNCRLSIESLFSVPNSRHNLFKNNILQVEEISIYTETMALTNMLLDNNAV